MLNATSSSLLFYAIKALQLASQATADMQGTYTYWGARLFSYLHQASPATQTYAFQMQVDNGARLWVDNNLVIDATCTPLAHQAESQVLCTPSPNIMAGYVGSSTKVGCLTMHSDIAACHKHQ